MREPTASRTDNLGHAHRRAAEGRSVDVELVEARPPSTVELRADDDTTCRYCLAEWTQAGQSALYSFLYRV
jgi:hypothetical protein